MKKKRIKRKKKLKLKKSAVRFFWLVIFITLCLEGLFYFNKKRNERIEEESRVLQLEKEKKQKEDYNACLVAAFSTLDETDFLKAKEDELTNYLKENYETSIGYFDVETGYSFYYNKDINYYAASTIKMLDAIYIYTKAASGDLDLDETIVYKSSNKRPASKEMQNYQVGDKVSLRNLVKYAITVSDNTAHDMLVEYIGFNNLKSYGLSLGATKTLAGSDIFGTMNINDALVYLKTLNSFIDNNGELGMELQSYFLNSEQNYLGFEDEGIKAAQKYGEYSIYYHENGIVYTKEPYLVSILTLEGKNGFEKVIRNINAKIYELHKAFYENRENYCYKEIYDE